MILGDLTHADVGKLVTIECTRSTDRAVERVRHVGLLEAFSLSWVNDELTAAEIRIAGVLQILTVFKNGPLADYQVTVA